MEKKSINYLRINFVFMMSLACSLLFFPSIVFAARLVPPPARAAATAAATRSAPVASTAAPTAASTAASTSVSIVDLAPTIGLIETAKTNKKSYDSARAGSPEKNQAKTVYEASVAAAVSSLQALATTATPEAAGNNKTKILGLIADNAPCNLDQAIGDGGASLFSSDLKNNINKLIGDLSAFGKDLNAYKNKWQVMVSNTASPASSAPSAASNRASVAPRANRSFSSR